VTFMTYSRSEIIEVSCGPNPKSNSILWAETWCVTFPCLLRRFRKF
jgi:hypothetical protein